MPLTRHRKILYLTILWSIPEPHCILNKPSKQLLRGEYPATFRQTHHQRPDQLWFDRHRLTFGLDGSLFLAPLVQLQLGLVAVDLGAQQPQLSSQVVNFSDQGHVLLRAQQAPDSVPREISGEHTGAHLAINSCVFSGHASVFCCSVVVSLFETQ